jgi:hypothetical protein
MMVIGGDPGVSGNMAESIYLPAANQWIPTTFNVAVVADHVSAWDGTRLIVYDGRDFNYNELDTGRAYKPRQVLYYYVKP